MFRNLKKTEKKISIGKKVSLKFFLTALVLFLLFIPLYIKCALK